DIKMGGIDAALVGVVLSDTIELRTSQTGKKWAAFNVGVGEGDNRQYLRISVFGSMAERVAAEAMKGDKLYIEGHSLRISEWTGRDGQQRSGLQMVGSKVEKAGTSAIGRNKPSRHRKPAGETSNGMPANIGHPRQLMTRFRFERCT